MRMVITERGLAGQTVFNTPVTDRNATVKVNGVTATIASQTESAVTLATPVAANDLVEITFSESEVVDRRTSGVLTTQNQAITMDVNGAGVIMVGVTGSFSMTAVFEGTIDGVNWISVSGTNKSNGSVSPNVSVPSHYVVDVSGLDQLRLRVSSASNTGAMQVSFQASQTPGAVAISQALPTGSNVIGSVQMSGAYGAAFTTNIAAGSNSSTVALDAGTALTRNKFNVGFFADKACNLYVQASTDNSTFYRVGLTSVAAGTGATISVPIVARYMRVNIANIDAAATASLWCSTSITST